MEPRTLVLTPSMQPTRIAKWTEGVVLWYLEKAEILESWDATVSSAHMTLRIPSVVRLKREVRRDKSQVKFSRSNVYARDGHKCAFCGKKFATKDLTYDHLIPRCRGGKTNFENILSSCRPCNTRKNNRTPMEAGMPLLFRPRTPKTLPHQPFLVDVVTCPELWRPYLGISQVA